MAKESSNWDDESEMVVMLCCSFITVTLHLPQLWHSGSRPDVLDGGSLCLTPACPGETQEQIRGAQPGFRPSWDRSFHPLNQSSIIFGDFAVPEPLKTLD